MFFIAVSLTIRDLIEVYILHLVKFKNSKIKKVMIVLKKNPSPIPSSSPITTSLYTLCVIFVCGSVVLTEKNHNLELDKVLSSI